ncbi:Arm DNA-binding domain-containing protein, partial [Klebsiella pneumoniae]
MALTDLAIRHARPLGKAYRLSDCHGLYIQVNPSGSKLWYLKFRFGNKENRMALG